MWIARALAHGWKALREAIAGSCGRQRIRVLVVDDEPGAAAALIAAFRAAGVVARHASPDALDRGQLDGYDVVIVAATSIGLAVAARLRGARARRRVALIARTTHATRGGATELFDARVHVDADAALVLRTVRTLAASRAP